MYEYRGLQDVIFLMLYGGVTLLALLACLYLLLRRGNTFVGEEIKSSRVLRRWTSALLAAIAASHVWWYVIGVYWLADDWLVRTIIVIMLDHVTLVPLTMAVLLAMLQDCRRPLWPWLVAQSPVVIFAFLGNMRCAGTVGGCSTTMPTWIARRYGRASSLSSFSCWSMRSTPLMPVK